MEDPFEAACAVDPRVRSVSSPKLPAPRLAPAPRRTGTEGAVPPLAFIHVPKTAGTSFTDALRAGWPEARIVGTQAAFDAIPFEELTALDLIAGHFLAWRLEERAGAHFAPVTVLRDPFERLFSAYRFGRQFARRGAQVGPAMRLAGEVDFGTWALSEFGPAQAHAQLYQLGLNRGDVAPRSSLTALLEQAKARLDRMLVGTTEALDAFVPAVFRHFGRNDAPAIGRAKITAEQYTPEEAGVTAAQRDALREVLRPDDLLYAHGRDLLQRRLERAAA